jgi:hypothetical protein
MSKIIQKAMLFGFITVGVSIISTTYCDAMQKDDDLFDFNSIKKIPESTKVTVQEIKNVSDAERIRQANKEHKKSTQK